MRLLPEGTWRLLLTAPNRSLPSLSLGGTLGDFPLNLGPMLRRTLGHDLHGAFKARPCVWMKFRFGFCHAPTYSSRNEDQLLLPIRLRHSATTSGALYSGDFDALERN